MEDLIKKLKLIQELLKAVSAPPPPPPTGMPVIPPPPTIPPITMKQSPVKAAKIPGIKPGSKKDPKKIAEQLKSAQVQKLNMPVLKSDSEQEQVEKGIKSTLAAAGVIGASLLGGNQAQAATPKPIKAPTTEVAAPAIKQKAPIVHEDSGQSDTVTNDSKGGGNPTLRERAWGPYKVTTSYNPYSDGNSKGHEMTHSVSWNGTAHSPEHINAISKEYDIHPNNIKTLNANPNHSGDGESYMHNSGKLKLIN